jgi:thioredoxin-like negative regulator of GroEL
VIRITALALVAAFALFHSFASAAEPYAQALARAQQTGQPLLIVVGADWCPPCQTLKHHTIPAMQRQGQLDGVAVAFVNVDREPGLARQFLRGGSIPQMVIARSTGEGWYRRHFVGAQSAGTIAATLREARSVASNVAPASTTPPSNESQVAAKKD